VSVFSYRWFPSSLYGGTIQYFKLNTAGSIARTIAKNEGLSEKEAMRCILKAVTDITAVNERKKVITAMLKTI
jgi:hypothetical protein